MNKIIIAIDGYSACGKSTTARAVATNLGYIYADSGAMYRAVTYYLLEHKISLTDIEEIERALKSIEIDFSRDKEGKLITHLNGQSVEEGIRKMAVSEDVSVVAAISVVRKAMVHIQRKLGKDKGVVMDGRDIGTVVFPEAELKIFMTADPEIRAQRRLKEWQANGIEATLEEVKANVAERDYKDTTREDSPLKKADDAIVVDNSFMTFDEQVEKVVALARERINA
jgi:CMP/dCMP kinase